MHVSRMEGAVTASRILSELYLNTPDECQGRTCWLVDLRDGRISMNANEVQTLARYLIGYRQQSECREEPAMIAVVVSDDESFGMLRMLYAYLEDSINLWVTRSIDDAKRWLADCPEDQGTTARTVLGQCA